MLKIGIIAQLAEQRWIRSKAMADNERIVETIKNLQKTHEQLREFIEQLTEENNKLKSQIKKAIEEIEDLDNA